MIVTLVGPPFDRRSLMKCVFQALPALMFRMWPKAMTMCPFVRGVNESVGAVKQLACSLLHVPQFHGVIVINDAACVVQDGFAHPALEGEWPVSSRC